MTSSTTFYFTVLLLTICAVASLACPHEYGTISVDVNTTTSVDNVVTELKKDKVEFRYRVKKIAKGEFSWDNIWYFTQIGEDKFELFDEAGNIVNVRPHSEKDRLRNIEEVLNMPANTRFGKVDSVASHIGNSVNKAYLDHYEQQAAKKEAAAAAKAQEVAKNITSEFLSALGGGAKVIEKAARDVDTKRFFGIKTRGFRGIESTIAM